MVYKSLIILLLIALSHPFTLMGQVKLCEKKALMYSKCYYFDSTGSFTYDYTHCNGSHYSFGSYVMKKRSIQLHFDSVISYPKLNFQKIDSLQDTVFIQVTHFFDNDPIHYMKVKYKDSVGFTDTNGQFKINYFGGEITVFQYFDMDSLVIYPATDSVNSYEIVWHFGQEYIHKPKTIKFRKIGNQYVLRKKIRKYNPKTRKYKNKRNTSFYK